jgi:hypothetical protein
VIKDRDDFITELLDEIDSEDSDFDSNPGDDMMEALTRTPGGCGGGSRG